MSGNSDGKKLEKDVEKYYKGLNRVDVVCRRIPDSHAARNYIQEQPADFVVSSSLTGAFHVECKMVAGTNKKIRKPKQYAFLRRWAIAGTPGIIVVHFYDLGIYAIRNIRDVEPLDKTIEMKKIFQTLDEALEETLCPPF